MNRIRNWTAIAAGLAVLLAAPLALAQSRPSLKVNVPFGFTASGKQFPSGTYMFARDSNGWISMADAAGNTKLRLSVITLLARSSPADDHLLAFDRLGEDRVLSEIWLPDQDGYLVNSERRPHKHELVRLVPKSRQ